MPGDEDVIETEPPDPGVQGKPSVGQVGAALQEEADKADREDGAHSPSEPLVGDEPAEDRSDDRG